MATDKYAILASEVYEGLYYNIFQVEIVEKGGPDERSIAKIIRPAIPDTIGLGVVGNYEFDTENIFKSKQKALQACLIMIANQVERYNDIHIRSIGAFIAHIFEGEMRSDFKHYKKQFTRVMKELSRG